MFKSVSNEQLIALVESELGNIEIKKISFDSRSHNTEYANIQFRYKNNFYQFVEIIDDNVFSLGSGSMTYEFIGNDNHKGFAILQAVVIKAQEYFDNHPDKLNAFLKRKEIGMKCECLGYLLDKSTAPDKPWELYTKRHGDFIKSYSSLAAVNTKLDNENNGIYDDAYEDIFDEEIETYTF